MDLQGIGGVRIGNDGLRLDNLNSLGGRGKFMTRARDLSPSEMGYGQHQSHARQHP